MAETDPGNPAPANPGRLWMAATVGLACLNGVLLFALLTSAPPSVEPEPCDCAAEIAAAAAAGGLDPAAMAAAPVGDVVEGEPVPEDGEDPRQDPGLDPETSARQFLTERMDALEAAAKAAGVDTTPWMPTPAEVDAAVLSEGPETPASLVVIEKLKAGHEALGLPFVIPPAPTAP